ncbi:unnamed protein product [Cuscuta campestris]|uniref:Transposase Tc1-like domain-containing protein n=1 Tax=Cuscuta campestris TaxID=132261 RepID=A0A484KB87_9ASTE|nr:unnamed protein product [Cuscuta campestris]
MVLSPPPPPPLLQPPPQTTAAPPLPREKYKSRMLQAGPFERLPIRFQAAQIQSRTSTNLKKNEIELLKVTQMIENYAQRGQINNLAAQFNVSRKIVSTIWAIAKKQLEQGVAINVRSRFIANSGRKRIVMDAQAIAETPLRNMTTIKSLAAAIGKPKSTVHEWIKKDCHIWGKTEWPGQGVAINVRSRFIANSGRKRIVMDAQAIAETPLRNMTTIKSLAAAIGKPKSTVHEWIKKGMLRSHSNAIKPYLTDANKVARLRFCLNQVERDSMPLQPRFNSFHNVLHIDEKWFFMSKTSQRFYLLPDEVDPYRTCKSKRFITKVMFLCVVGRPLITDDGEVLWDGKVGIFHFSELVKAKKRARTGTKELWR